MKNKVEIIDKSNFKVCNKCKGDGCKYCSEGIYIDESFIIVGETKDCQKLAVQSDFTGK